MNIYGFMIVKDEADILAQTIQSLLKFGGFRKIFIFDNNSTDDTYDVAQRFASETLSIRKLDRPYSDDLKYDMVYSMADQFETGDWFSILDGDELFCENQREVVQEAAVSMHNCIEHNTAQFYFTENEDNFRFDRNQPAIEQRQHYLLNYGEPRIFQYSPERRLTADLVKGRSPLLLISKRKMMVHHFQYRSALQVEKRISNRIENNKTSNNWGHVQSVNWRDYLVPARHLHRYDGTIKSGLPNGANLYKIRDNAAYTMANILWLKKNNALTPDQAEFLTTNKWQRMLRKIW